MKEESISNIKHTKNKNIGLRDNVNFMKDKEDIQDYKSDNNISVNTNILISSRAYLDNKNNTMLEKHSSVESFHNSNSNSKYLNLLLKEGKNSLFLDKPSEYKLQLIFQNNIIKEYESWTHLLLNIINHTKSNEKNPNHVDYATPIQKHLEKLSKIEMESFDLQKKFIRINTQIEDNQKELEKSKTKKEILSQDLKKADETLILEENDQLIESIDMMTEELDQLSLHNKNLTNYMDKDCHTIFNLMKEIKDLEKENEELLAIKNLSYIDLFSNRFSLLPESKKTPFNNLYGNPDFQPIKNEEREIIIRKRVLNNKSKIENNSFLTNHKSSNSPGGNKSSYTNFDISSLSCFNNNIEDNDSTINYINTLNNK